MTLIRRDFKNIFRFTVYMIAVWIVAIAILVFFRNFGIEESYYYQIEKAFDYRREGLLVLIMGILTGFFYSILEIFFDRPYFQRISFGKVILIKNIFYFISAKVIFLLMTLFYTWYINVELNKETMFLVLRGKLFWVVLVYFLLISILISFVLQVSQKFGPGMLWKFVTGKYHHPVEEERIFLFIDMKSSTTIAEQLGHIKFSQLIQDCFFDLTDVITSQQVDIYQYVGDEAVLSWHKEIGIIDHRCIRAYFQYMEILNFRKDYYRETYGLEPFFKAGLHMGKVTVAEVGVVKKEIAYHGDVLNTTARIQGECNNLGQAILASEEIIKTIPGDKKFNYQKLDTLLLKGKLEEVGVYGIQSIAD